MKRDSFVIRNTKTVIHLSQVAQFVCAPLVYHKMPGIKKSNILLKLLVATAY